MSPQGVPLTWHFSLPTQRCFPPWQDLPRGFLLFSAYAEVFPEFTHPQQEARDFSLPTQRCFQCLWWCLWWCLLFSAYAEVFLRLLLTLDEARDFSLPTQRCFQASRASLALTATFLCLRRGVSPPQSPGCSPLPFSLPTQRCF